LRFRVLGCYGGSAPGLRPTSYLINERVAIDGGALTNTLTVAEQANLTHVFLSHSHIDHLCTLPFLADNVLLRLREPIALYGPEDTVQCLHQHLFNGRLWPDFTRISNGRAPVLTTRAAVPGVTLHAHGLEITPFAMTHAVACHGHLVQEADGSVIVCGDTVSTAGLAEVLPRARGLRAVVLECSFPRGLATIAALSKHLSTDAFALEAKAVPADVRLLVTHLKPGCEEAVRAELLGLGLKNLSFLEQDREYDF
jgi:ribonuclease BN (tRNA processing enzyme)